MSGFENPPISETSKLSPKEEKKNAEEDRALLALVSSKGLEGGITAASWHSFGKGKRNQGCRAGFQDLVLEQHLWPVARCLLVAAFVANRNGTKA